MADQTLGEKAIPLTAASNTLRPTGQTQHQSPVASMGACRRVVADRPTPRVNWIRGRKSNSRTFGKGRIRFRRRRIPHPLEKRGPRRPTHFQEHYHIQLGVNSIPRHGVRRKSNSRMSRSGRVGRNGGSRNGRCPSLIEWLPRSSILENVGTTAGP